SPSSRRRRPRSRGRTVSPDGSAHSLLWVTSLKRRTCRGGPEAASSYHHAGSFAGGSSARAGKVRIFRTGDVPHDRARYASQHTKKGTPPGTIWSGSAGSRRIIHTATRP